MKPVSPFWMTQRQVKTEAVGDNALRLVAPNLPVYEVVLEQTPTAEWSGVVYRLSSVEGEKEKIGESQAKDQEDAWQAAFEVYRRQVVT